MNKYNVGDTVYFIANGYHIREATVILNKTPSQNF